MAKLSQSAIKQRADEWAAKLDAIRKSEAAREKALAPVIERHNEEMKPLVAPYDRKIEKLQAEADAIEGEVLEWLDRQDEDITLAGKNAVAASLTETKIGSRVIDVQKFISAAKSKGEAMWDCVSIAIAKAEKLVGKKELDAISTKKETVVTTNSLRLK